MDTRLKNYSHALTTKIILFIVVVSCFTGVMNAFFKIEVFSDGNMGIVFQDNYLQSRAFLKESEKVLNDLTRLLSEFKNEQHILDGGSITEAEMQAEENRLYYHYRVNSKSYRPELGPGENYEKFKTVYAEHISKARERLIKDDLGEYHMLVNRLETYKDVRFYASDGENVFSNSTRVDKAYFKTHPSYMLYEEYEEEVYPAEIKKNEYYYPWITNRLKRLDPENSVVFIAFPETFLASEAIKWDQDKVTTTRVFNQMMGFLLALLISFGYLAVIFGRDSFKDKQIGFNTIDRIYNDIKVGLILGLIGLWAGLLSAVQFENMHKVIIPVTLPISALGLVLVLSFVKHFKNKTVLKHTLVYQTFYKFFRFIKGIFDSGSVGVKIVLTLIGYPILIALTFFMFPITIGFAIWLAMKKVKAFNAIKEGVERVKAGNLHHTINVQGTGEFAQLAANINSIADGLKNAVDKELKSERLKTELITNVSHDIRTPLTSIITYVDLLKREQDPGKVAEYVEVLDQKSQRLKVLTDDLFEAAKASSGNIPVELERIDIVSLLNQGLGELNDKIEASNLQFKMNYPQDKVYVVADGKLLWRAIENLISNIFKYALEGSRVYIDIEDQGSEILLSIKNISAFELNISAEELMERFKRGDESRSSQGSGLGLSIAKSLIDLQKGKFYIQVDGDLFKALVYMPKSTGIE